MINTSSNLSELSRDEQPESVATSSENQFLKTYLFNKNISKDFLVFIQKSKDFDIVLNYLFAQFTQNDWGLYKNEIFSFIINMLKDQNLSGSSQGSHGGGNYSHRVNKLNIAYSHLAPHLQKGDWELYLSVYNKTNPISQKLQPYFFSFVEKKSALDLLIKYISISYSQSSGASSASEIIKLLDSVNIKSIDMTRWASFLSCIEPMRMSQKQLLIEHYLIEPTYSAETFMSFLNHRARPALYNDGAYSSAHSYGERSIATRGNKLNLSGLSSEALSWFIDKLNHMSTEQINSFFENKFNLQGIRKNLNSREEINSLAKKEFKGNRAQLSDYIYLLSFCQLILNPSNKSQATQLALSLNDYLNSKMADKSKLWWEKLQEIIKKEELRKFLPYTTNAVQEWSSIYEKVALDKIIDTKRTASVKSKNKL